MDTEQQQPPNDIESNTEPARKLASIQLVSLLTKHPNADTLWIATVLGWQVIVKDGEVSVGDKIIFCEIDSLIDSGAKWLPQPVQDRIKREKAASHFRVKTIQLRQQISQGLIIPICDTLPPLVGIGYGALEIGTDLTSHLKILKYELPVFNFRYPLFFQSKVSTFPSSVIAKTDELRIQSYPSLLETLLDKPYYISLKMDGTSATYLIHPTTNEFIVASRNMSRVRPEIDEETSTTTTKCPYWHIAISRKIEDNLRSNNSLHLAIQGEICGPNIQMNLAGLNDYEFFVFNVTNLDTKTRLSYQEMKEECNKLNLKMVPVEEDGEQFPTIDIATLLIKAKGKYEGTKNSREGLVVRSQDQQITFKVINNDYLIAQK